MSPRKVSRRTLLQGGASLAALELFRSRMPAQAAPKRQGNVRLSRVTDSRAMAMSFPVRPGEEVLPWLDQPAPNPVPEIVDTLLTWENLDSWITPNDEFFTVKHFNLPEIDSQAWRLKFDGLVGRSLTLSLDDLMARPRQEVDFTLECSGNTGLPFLIGAIGNATWTGTPLAPILQEAGVVDEGTEVVFWGMDSGPAEVGGVEVNEQFARSMSLEDALDPRNILCYSMNGEPLPAEHGGPVRLIAPGWFGVANVKWLDRIELLDTRYQGRFMAREYVTLREAEQNGETVGRYTSVGRDLLKSAPAKVTRLDGSYRIVGAAWGAPIASVEVQIDGGAWLPATLDEGHGADHAWTIWSLAWDQPAEGEHALTSRAIDTEGNIQPAMDDPLIANKLTFWESNGQITRRVFIGDQSFPDTGYTLTGPFLAFWLDHGGLKIFGNPITAEFDEQSVVDGQTYRVQYFERQRFELHPGSATPYGVQLGLLGIESLPGMAPYPRAEPHVGAGCEYFEPTGHNVCGRFREFWHLHGGLAIFGYPITEAFDLELDGPSRTVQFFERARFEHHPENDAPNDVLLGLLGYEVLGPRGG